MCDVYITYTSFISLFIYLVYLRKGNAKHRSLFLFYRIIQSIEMINDPNLITLDESVSVVLKGIRIEMYGSYRKVPIKGR